MSRKDQYKEIPLIMSAPMVTATRAGHKRQTRRLTGLDYINENPDGWKIEAETHLPKGQFTVRMTGRLSPEHNEESFDLECPFGHLGSVLWVRENWGVDKVFNQISPTLIAKQTTLPRIYYAADGPFPVNVNKLRPNIHMPRLFCREFLEVKGLALERLHDISELDAAEEGVDKVKSATGKDGQRTFWIDPIDGTFRNGFIEIFDHLHGPETWDLNKWVWAVTFEEIIDYQP